MDRPAVTLKNSWNEWNDLSGSYLPRRLKVPAVPAPSTKGPAAKGTTTAGRARRN